MEPESDGRFPPDTAANWFPSADKATECQFLWDALIDTQVVPEFVEV
jgi:hypothetical protein